MWNLALGAVLIQIQKKEIFIRPLDWQTYFLKLQLQLLLLPLLKTEQKTNSHFKFSMSIAATSSRRHGWQRPLHPLQVFMIPFSPPIIHQISIKRQSPSLSIQCSLVQGFCSARDLVFVVENYCRSWGCQYSVSQLLLFIAFWAFSLAIELQRSLSTASSPFR